MFTDSPKGTCPKIAFSTGPGEHGIQIKTFSFPEFTLDPELRFQPSDYGVETRGNRVLDLQTRDSSYSFTQISGIMEHTHHFLITYLKEFKAEPELNKEWRVLKYENGHFDWHSDHEKQHESMRHLGTEILLPPESQCAYNGGELDIQLNSISMQIRPDPIDWTHVIIPLGIRHRVRRVEGVRFSFTKPIFYRPQRDNSWMKNRYVSYRFDQ